MLILQDSTDFKEHQFVLDSITADAQKQLFKLTSTTYPDLGIQFTLEPPIKRLPVGYTVSVHLFKNPFHRQHEVIDLRTPDRAQSNGKIGYMFSLEALFTPGSLQLDQHTYCYAYFGVQSLFKDKVTFQTKDSKIKGDPYDITDFFDDDTIILVLCNEFCEQIPDFSLDNYLPNLFLNGFTLLNSNNAIEAVNNHPYLEEIYDKFIVTDPPNPDGVYPMRLQKAKISISGEAYVVHLFTNLIQKNFDQVTRFLMLYQVIEIFMPKMIHLEVSQRLCNNLTGLTTDKVKELVNGLTKQIELITALLSRHAIPSRKLSALLHSEILDFFIHVNHPDYSDPEKNAKLSLSDLFYGFRNKIVHEYRILHTRGVDAAITTNKIQIINQLTEVLVAETITVFIG